MDISTSLDIDVYILKPTCQSKQTFKFGSECNRLIPDMVILILWSPPSCVHIDGMSQLLVGTCVKYAHSQRRALHELKRLSFQIQIGGSLDISKLGIQMDLVVWHSHMTRHPLTLLPLVLHHH